jgi:hypothetical protein
MGSESEHWQRHPFKSPCKYQVSVYQVCTEFTWLSSLAVVPAMMKFECHVGDQVVACSHHKIIAAR